MLREPIVPGVKLLQQVLEICRVHLPAWHRGVFDDPRVKMIYRDAVDFLNQTKSTFDVVICDLFPKNLKVKITAGSTKGTCGQYGIKLHNAPSLQTPPCFSQRQGSLPGLLSANPV